MLAIDARQLAKRFGSVRSAAADLLARLVDVSFNHPILLALVDAATAWHFERRDL